MEQHRRPDPDCPYCHGSGVIDLSAPFLDRIDESTTPCRCMKRPAEADEELRPEEAEKTR